MPLSPRWSHLLRAQSMMAVRAATVTPSTRPRSQLQHAASPAGASPSSTAPEMEVQFQKGVPPPPSCCVRLCCSMVPGCVPTIGGVSPVTGGQAGSTAWRGPCIRPCSLLSTVTDTDNAWSR